MWIGVGCVARAGLAGRMSERRTRIGWFLLFIWSVWFVWLNQTNQINPSQLSNEHFLILYISF